MKLSDLYPTTTITMREGSLLDLKFDFQALLKMEEFLADKFQGKNIAVDDLIMDSFTSNHMAGETLVIFLRAMSGKSAEEIIGLIDLKQLEEYRRAIMKAWVDSRCNEEQIKALEELEEKKRDLIEGMVTLIQNPIPNLNSLPQCPGDLVGAAKCFWSQLKESVTRLFCKKPQKN